MSAPDVHSHAEVTNTLDHAVAAVLIVPKLEASVGGITVGWECSVVQRGGPYAAPYAAPSSAELVDMLRTAANGLEALG